MAKIRVSGSDLAAMLVAGGYKGFSPEQEKKIGFTPESKKAFQAWKSKKPDAPAKPAASKPAGFTPESKKAFQAWKANNAGSSSSGSARTPLPRVPETDADAQRVASAYQKLQANKANSAREQRRYDKMEKTQNKEFLKEMGEPQRKLKMRVSNGQKTDAQSKTAKLGRKGKWKEAQGGKGRAGVSKIAKQMKADGKTGWVTIAGAKINLGGE